MRILVVTQIYHLTGQKKIWRLKPQKKIFSFGRSRDADLQSIDPGLDTFQAAIEYRENLWVLLDFQSKNWPCCRELKDSEQISFQNSSLNLVVDHSRSNRALQLQRLKMNFSGYSRFNLTEILNRRSHWNWRSPEARLGLSLLLCSILTLLLSAAFSEKKIKSPSAEVILSGQKVFIQKQKKTVAQKSQGLSASKSQQFKKVSGLLAKNSLGSRLTQLLGKVSATEARTAQLLKSRGAEAGTRPSGRALATLAQGDFSGQNWAEKAGSGAPAIGTRGLGGGGDAGSLGTALAQGSTGSGGVALIEEESEVSGGLDREVIAQYIKTRLGQILYCYERQLSATPDIYGKVNVKFTIAGSGQVEAQAVNESTLQSRPVENCVLSKISRWRFPEPRGGIKVVVTYPFIFKSTH